LASSALRATRPTGAGVEPAALSPVLAPPPQAVADIVLITTQEDFLPELGAVLPARAAVHPFESLNLALEQLSASRRVHILVFDTRGLAELRNQVGRAYARLPEVTILLFAHAADVEGMRRVFKGSKIFAVLPIPMDSAKTALAFSAALIDAAAKIPATPARTAAAPAPVVAQVSLTPSNDGWGIGAGVALGVLACAWFITANKQPAVSAAAPAQRGAPTAEGARRKNRTDVPLAGAAQTTQEKAESTIAAPGAVEHPALPQAHLELTRYVVPEFPAAARARHLRGSVIVAYTVDTLGVTRHIHVVSAEPAGIFNHDAVDAVRRWRYAPVVVGNAAVAVPTHATIRFTPQ